MEAFLALLLLPAVTKSGHGPVGVRAGVVGALLVLLVVVAAMWRRHRRFAVVAGSMLQVALIACGAFIWPMYILGVIFAALWVVAVRMSRAG